MASRKLSERVREWLQAYEAVTEPVYAELVRAFPDINPRTLRKAVRALGLPMDAMVEGVRQDSLEGLARTLTALQVEYHAASQTNDRARMQQIRAMIIESKAHARFASRRNPEKQEIVEWMLVWLQDPALFDTWAKLRLRSIGERSSSEVAGPDTGEADQH